MTFPFVVCIDGANGSNTYLVTLAKFHVTQHRFSQKRELRFAGKTKMKSLPGKEN